MAERPILIQVNKNDVEWSDGQLSENYREYSFKTFDNISLYVSLDIRQRPAGYKDYKFHFSSAFFGNSYIPKVDISVPKLSSIKTIEDFTMEKAIALIYQYANVKITLVSRPTINRYGRELNIVKVETTPLEQNYDARTFKMRLAIAGEGYSSYFELYFWLEGVWSIKIREVNNRQPSYQGLEDTNYRETVLKLNDKSLMTRLSLLLGAKINKRVAHILPANLTEQL